MKKFIFMLTTLLMCMGIAGCGSKEELIETGYRDLTWNMEEKSVKELLDQNKDLVHMPSKDELTYGSTDVNDPMVVTSLKSDDFVYETYTFVDEGLSEIDITFRSKSADLTTYLKVVERFKTLYGVDAELTYHSDISDCYTMNTDKVTINLIRMVVVSDGYEISINIAPVTKE